MITLQKYRETATALDTRVFLGEVQRVIGLTVESAGPLVEIGDLCYLCPTGKQIWAEVVGFKENSIILMPFGSLDGVAPGCPVRKARGKLKIPVGDAVVGRVLDGIGQPVDGQGPLLKVKYRVAANRPPNPLKRTRISEVLPVGVKAIDGFITCAKGQRIGIFAGSGVGKSTLLSMIARNSAADVTVIALIGERGREVKEFLERDLGKEGLQRSVVVAATSDEPPLMRLKGAFTATAIAEYFRDQGLDVMFLMDSLTRFAMAGREIGLASGELPASRGYTPSVFTLLPKLVERAGTGERGTITAFYTVLVEGDDLEEPIADAVRALLDGHIVLARDLAAKNHYPAIDILGSVSRLMNDVASEKHLKLAGELRRLLAVYRSAEDLINIGAYKQGTSPEIDRAISLLPVVNGFLRQGTGEYTSFKDTLSELAEIVGGGDSA